MWFYSVMSAEMQAVYPAVWFYLVANTETAGNVSSHVILFIS